MSDSALKSLTRETKALIIVNEYEARKMPVFQMRAVLNAIIVNDEERKVIIDLIEKDLRATGYPAEEITGFLGELVQSGPSPAAQATAQALQGTRRLRSPFAMQFEGVAPPPPDLPNPFKPAAAGHASESPMDKPLQVPPPPPKLSTPPLGVPLRRKTFVIEASAPPPSAPTAVPGTRAWREQFAFSQAPLPGTEESRRRPIVLLADDDKRIRLIFRLRLEEAGFCVTEADNGHEAWEKLQKGDVVAAVLDMKMPGLHGLEVLSNLQAKQIQTPVVICSAYDQLQDEIAVKTHPHLRYLVKPVAPENLVAAIRELLKPKA